MAGVAGTVAVAEIAAVAAAAPRAAAAAATVAPGAGGVTRSCWPRNWPRPMTDAADSCNWFGFSRDDVEKGAACVLGRGIVGGRQRAIERYRRAEPTTQVQPDALDKAGEVGRKERDHDRGQVKGTGSVEEGVGRVGRDVDELVDRPDDVAALEVLADGSHRTRSSDRMDNPEGGPNGKSRPALVGRS